MQRSSEEKVFGEIRLARPAVPEACAPLRETTRVSCPLCASVIVVLDDEEPAELNCAVCGMTFPFTPPRAVETPPPRGTLENWLAGKPLQPRSLSRWERFRQWYSERPYLLGTTAALLLILSVVSWFSISAYRDARLRLHEISQQLEERQRQGEESSAAVAAQNDQPQPTAPKLAESPAASAPTNQSAKKTETPAVDPPAKPTAPSQVAKKAPSKPAGPPATTAAQDKVAKKTTASPADAPAAAAGTRPTEESSLPTLESAQRDAPLR